GEGMWVPQQLPEIAGPLKKAGLKLSPQQISDLTGDPMGAVVALGGCTASFVSPNGLVVTNHHCAYGAIQLNSTAENNLIKNGFNAPTTADEVSAGPNARVFVLDEITDVTKDAKAAIAAAGDDALARTKALEAFEKKLIADCEAEAGFRCRLYSFSGGNTYRLFKNLEIKDVRLAYAPPGSVGKFGGDIDNWMWPRHTGDFAFYRAYVGKDGKPAAFSKDNVPYQPKHWLKFADQPLGAGDFVMVAGYPGSTNRYALAAEFDNTAQWTYPTIARHYKNQIAMVEAAGKQNADIQVKYAATMAGWNNTSKNYDGQLEGFKRIDAAGQKLREEAAVLGWLKGQGAKGQPALDAHAKLLDLLEQSKATRDRDLTLALFNNTAMLGSATQLYRLSIEREKPNAERESGYQERDLPAIEGGLKQLERRYVAAMDRQLQEYWLNEYIKLPADQRVAAVDAWLGGNDAAAVKRALDRLAGTKLGSTEERLKWFAADRKAFEASNDPAIQYAVAVMPTLLKLEQERKTRAGENLAARPVYLQALADYKKSQGEFVYPDANLSLRITFGNVMGYAPKDGMEYTPFTTLEGVVAKETGQDPFDSPKALLDAVAAKRYGGLEDKRIGSVPVNYLSDLDITGGNSGSPVLDAHGKLVGLAFDGNWESVSSNWVFDPKMTRMIAVDGRYLRWIMQEVYPAPQLLKEMNVGK
nr:Chain A, dipeptidyl aminopeptidase BII [Pseudoxanthomonas mexicana]3WOJ_B Chain B, dipeptidyl aminopeptidase BII [Pseudoxanthomonas mexicana]3WOL_A Chain A, dipeptidyl aminopeptidase BII [Pseudoxanthomonas mexicana]3WOL_B Chain B, dipeptidyl aminopeptidase BII [Pseudoxanthomonas mexicana]3WOM_A Chain A, dipeptidyl aminopeptidase BII [Pseudoxanthomonas mexicana]3WOM_B Chain B, dipeptidyl aminopeptidase BII [Pseudoxanthomonas mexicana]3WON_A Chain A, dipeptidyl aminopeptidase BII [Pseudoxant